MSDSSSSAMTSLSMLGDATTKATAVTLLGANGGNEEYCSPAEDPCEEEPEVEAIGLDANGVPCNVNYAPFKKKNAPQWQYINELHPPIEVIT